jgi:hypothetical protein
MSRHHLNFNYLLGIIFYSHYIVGILSPTVSGLTLLPIVAAIIAILLNPRTSYFKYDIVLLIIVLVIMTTISFMLSSKGDYSQYKYIMLLAKSIPFILIAGVSIEENNSFMNGVFTILVLFVLASLAKSAEFVLNPNIHNRIETGVFNPIWISRAAFEAVLISIIVLRKSKYSSILTVVVAILIAYASGSKGPIVAVIVALAFWYFRDSNKALLRVSLILGVVATVLVAIFKIMEHDTYLIQRFFLIVPTGSSDWLTVNARDVMWPKTISLLLDQDLFKTIFGNGLGEFSSFFQNSLGNQRFYPHNIVLELLVEFGLLPTLLTLIYAGQLLIKSKSMYKYIFLYFIVNSMFSGDLILNEYIYFYLGMTVYDGKRA